LRGALQSHLSPEARRLLLDLEARAERQQSSLIWVVAAEPHVAFVELVECGRLLDVEGGQFVLSPHD